MKRLALVTACLLLAACADASADPRTFDNNDLELATGNGALMGCSCRFVMNMPEAYCQAWIKASPDVTKVTFDVVNKTAEASAFLSWSAKAHYVDEKRGCVLQ